MSVEGQSLVFLRSFKNVRLMNGLHQQPQILSCGTTTIYCTFRCFFIVNKNNIESGCRIETSPSEGLQGTFHYVVDIGSVVSAYVDLITRTA